MLRYFHIRTNIKEIGAKKKKGASECLNTQTPEEYKHMKKKVHLVHVNADTEPLDLFMFLWKYAAQSAQTPNAKKGGHSRLDGDTFPANCTDLIDLQRSLISISMEPVNSGGH